MSLLSIIVDIVVILTIASLVSFILRSRSKAVNFVLLVIVGILMMMLISMGEFIVSLIAAMILLAALVILLLGYRIM